MEGRIVIVAYKPKMGGEQELRELMQEHLSILKKENLVTDRESIIMVAGDGTIIEVFEWKSATAMQQAHANPAVQELWSRYAKVCDYIPVSEVEETKRLFSDFSPFS